MHLSVSSITIMVLSLHYVFVSKSTDENECEEMPDACGKHTTCFNTNGSYYCQCSTGFREVKGLVNFTGLTGQCLGE